MPEAIGYTAKSETVRTQQAVARAVQDSVMQTPPELESRKKAPAVEVKLSNEAMNAEAGVQPRQNVDTYEALNRKT